MGLAARAAYDSGGKVTGIYPHAMRSICPVHFSTNIQVPDMHSRKRLMAAKVMAATIIYIWIIILLIYICYQSIAFMVLPGGIGTLEEVMEMTTW